MIVRIENLVVKVYLERGVSQVADRLDQRVEHGERIHVGPQTLHVHTDDEVCRSRSGAAYPGFVEHVRMGMNQGRPTPTLAYHLGSARSQGDQLVGGADQHVQLLVVWTRVGLMRIAQVVHGVNQGLAVARQLIDDSTERIGADGVEAEVEVEDVELTVVLGDPLWVQHQWWPPSARHFRTINRNGIIEPDHRIHPVGVGQMADIQMRFGNRRDANQLNSWCMTPVGKLGR